MAPLFDYLSSRLKPYYNIILISVILIIFIVFSYFIYIRQISPKLNDKSKVFKDVANNGETGKQVDVMLFHVNWCPHCIKAKPDWESFCNEYNGKMINGYKINCDPKGNDCTEDSDPIVAAWIKEYDITSYPTVILVKDEERYVFDAKLTRNALEQFVETTTR